jgi:4-phytase/acid phosphatase
LSPSTKLLAGVELGGTKCVCILGTGPEDVRAVERLPTGNEPEHKLRQIELVFERWRRADGQRVIRLRYTAQSLAQLRERRTLTLQAPPPSAPVFIPGCSSATPGYDCALPTLAALIGAAIDPQFLSE